MPSMDSEVNLAPHADVDRTDEPAHHDEPDTEEAGVVDACDRCHDPVDEDVIETVRGSTICIACADSAYWQCETCDGWNREPDDCGNGCHDSYGCDCDDCDDGGLDTDFGGLVHDYSFKPWPDFHGTGPLFLGPEIEVETPYGAEYECADIAASHLGDLGYLKADASLDNGFEIVTHPMSYQWAIDNFPWNMLTELAEAGCRTSTNTGLHVHLSRAGFDSASHIYRWMKFIYRNQRHVTALARRSSNQWAAFTDDDRRAIKDYAKGACGDRHRAINTGNTDTLELRVFASSLDPDEVQAAFGFAVASVEYTRTLTYAAVVEGGWTWPAFTTWAARHPDYTPLTRQLRAGDREVAACAC